MRLVNRAAANRVPATRRCMSAWDETSIAQAVSPASRIRAEQRLQLDRVGRRVRHGQHLAADARLDGPDEPGAVAGRLEHGTQQERGRGLAVGAGHADHERGRRTGDPPTAAAASAIARRASGTTTWGMATPGTSRSTTAAAAPRDAASAT